MREFKFRAWDTDNGNMYYSDRDEDNGEGPIIWYANAQGLYFEENCLIDREMGGEHHQYTEYRKPNQVLMQFTGLKDKDGVEIYEGDVVSLDGLWTRKLWAVVWCDNRWGLEYENESYDNGDQYRGDDIEWNQAEVVGNIYENPDLLT